MSDYSLAVEIREATGKSVTRKLRAAGRLPGVLYGHGKDAVSVTLDPRDLETLLEKSDAGVNTLIDLEGESSVSGRIVLVKELQRHPVQGTLVHADFFEIDAAETISVTVPIHLIGTPVGIKLGGLTEHTLREIELQCLPKSIPDSVELDISELDLNDTLHLSDLVLPEGTECALDGSLAVVHVSIPKIEEEPVVAEEADAEGAVPAEGEAAAAPAEADTE